MKIRILLAGVGMLGVLSCAAVAQQAATPAATLDAKAVTFGSLKDLNWTGVAGERRALLYGDPEKEGPYGIVYEWAPGHNSKPHSHAATRYGYVISGTWWTSTSTKEDKSTLVPVPAGSFVTHYANQVHWDGGVDNTAYVLVTGMGPIKTTRLAQ